MGWQWEVWQTCPRNKPTVAAVIYSAKETQNTPRGKSFDALGILIFNYFYPLYLSHNNLNCILLSTFQKSENVTVAHVLNWLVWVFHVRSAVSSKYWQLFSSRNEAATPQQGMYVGQSGNNLPLDCGHVAVHPACFNFARLLDAGNARTRTMPLYSMSIAT